MDSLVTTEWLATQGEHTDIVVLDATRNLPGTPHDPRADFAAAHIPGARYLDMPSLFDAGNPVSNAMPTQAQLAERLGSLGVTRKTRVVLYDNSDIASAARAWFILHAYGHCAVAVLDGGWRKWMTEDRPVESGTVTPRSSDYQADPNRAALRSKADMLANMASRAEQLVDARDRERFEGTTQDTVHDLPGGHIPGARNMFFRDVFRADGTYRSAGELRDAFRDAGIDLDRPLVASCGSGMTASVLLFALHLAGKDDAALYDGSWAEWGADPATPKQLGPAA